MSAFQSLCFWIITTKKHNNTILLLPAESFSYPAFFICDLGLGNFKRLFGSCHWDLLSIKEKVTGMVHKPASNPHQTAVRHFDDGATCTCIKGESLMRSVLKSRANIPYYPIIQGRDDLNKSTLDMFSRCSTQWV